MVVKVERVAATALFALLFFLCLASAAFALVGCPPNPIERNLEIDCTWNGAPVRANLKWTEPEDNAAATTNTDAGSKSSQSGTASSQANKAAINTQQVLMLTGAASGAALAGGGIFAVKKKLEGGTSSEKETKQTTSTSTTSSTAPKYTSDNARSGREVLEQHQNELKSSTQSQSSTQNQQLRQSDVQNPPKDNGPPTTAGQQYMQKQMNSQSSQQSQPPTHTQQSNQSGVGNYQNNELTSTTSNFSASAATITKELLMQKQMDSLTKQSTQAGGTQQPKQETAPSASTSTTSQSIGLLASSSSAARIATEMWPKRQKELEQLAKQRSDLAAKFSTPSYSKGLGLASSFTSAIGNPWAKLKAVGNGIDRMGAAIKPYTTYIAAATCIAIIFVSMFFTYGATAPAAPGIMAGTGLSLSQGAGIAGGILVGGITLYAAHNTFMNYPKQPSFGVEHTQIIQQPQTSEIKDEKGSGTYGEDVAQEQLEQAEIRKDRIYQTGTKEHQEAEQKLRELIKELGGKNIGGPKLYRGNYLHDGRDFERYPDVTSDRFIGEAKRGMEKTNDEFQHIWEEVYKDISLQERDGLQAVWYILKKPPADNVEWQNIITMLMNNGVIVRIGNG